VAGRGIGISWSRPPVLAKWQKISVGIKPVAAGELPAGFRVISPPSKSRAPSRRRKGKTLTSPCASSILRRFRQHLAGRYAVAEVTAALLDDAMRLGIKHALRAYLSVRRQPTILSLVSFV
jgi:hypothetical protein